MKKTKQYCETKVKEHYLEFERLLNLKKAYLKELNANQKLIN